MIKSVSSGTPVVVNTQITLDTFHKRWLDQMGDNGMNGLCYEGVSVKDFVKEFRVLPLEYTFGDVHSLFLKNLVSPQDPKLHE